MSSAIHVISATNAILLFFNVTKGLGAVAVFALQCFTIVLSNAFSMGV